MFERYTERARRTLFFARYEASQMGAMSIDTEHLLLGLLRESKGVIGIIFSRSHLTFDEVATELYRQSADRKKIATSVEIPFTPEVKRVLNFGAEEADRLLDRYIGPEHLLLGLLREEQSVAASILRDHGLQLDDVRAQIRKIAEPADEQRGAATPVRDAAGRIRQIKAMVRRLAELSAGSAEARDLVTTILAMLEDLAEGPDE